MSDQKQSFVKLPTPNARVLYKSAPLLEWMARLGDLEVLVENHPQLQRANPFTYLYFFEAQNFEKWASQSVWVGIEIIGAVNADSLVGALGDGDQDFQLMDLDGDHCWSRPCLLTDFKSVFSQQQKARGDCEESVGQKLAETWRLCYEQKSGQWQIHFFEEKKGE